MVFSFVPEIRSVAPQKKRRSPSRLNILAVLLAGTHCTPTTTLAYNGYSPHRPPGHPDRHLGESNIQTLYTFTPPQGGRLQPSTGPEQCSSDRRIRARRENQPKPKPLNHLPGFSHLQYRAVGVTVATLRRL
ncbi:hypothetical protein TYRP_015457 [Tyrophagus putrescentiae]|nr:hypothetical protein TYRP_015457 [Tyrophagus putrescentiae]